MSRVDGFAGGDGTARSAAQLSVVYTAIVAASATLDGTNLAEEGLDARNIGARELSALDKAGTRPCYAEYNTETTFTGAGAGDYRNEGTTPAVMGASSAILDWSGQTYSPAADEILMIEAHVAVGSSTGYGFSTAGSALAEGVSAVILLSSDGMTYAVQSKSRQSFQALADTALNDNNQRDSFDLCPMLMVTGGTVSKIGVAIGTSNAGGASPAVAIVSSIQIHATILKKAR